jgi:peptide/nickel transport system ATP-binding protein/oligopeptide transport system ATP-binding protein
MPLLEVQDLRVHFAVRGRGDSLKAVDGVDFTVAAGETFGVIGESGSGKSTLGRALVCLTRPTQGRVLHGGQDPNGMSRSALRRHRRRYQVIFQDPHSALDPRMTILDSVREPLDLNANGMRTSERNATAMRMIEQVGLRADLARAYPHELSGGQKQRVNIARALTVQPALLVCDEVTAALDVSIQADILNLFADLQRHFGLTYVFITHDLSVVSHVSDRIAVMYLGRIMETASATTLEARPLHPYTQALLSAEPSPLPDTRHGPRIRLQGEIPSPFQPPSGCRFRTRCPIAEARCADEVPAWREIEPAHWVACHFAGPMAAASGPA